MLIDFNLTLLNLSQNSWPETHLQIQAAPWIEVAVCFFYGVRSIFIVLRCSKYFLLDRI